VSRRAPTSNSRRRTGRPSRQGRTRPRIRARPGTTHRCSLRAPSFRNCPGRTRRPSGSQARSPRSCSYLSERERRDCVGRSVRAPPRGHAGRSASASDCEEARHEQRQRDHRPRHRIILLLARAVSRSSVGRVDVGFRQCASPSWRASYRGRRPGRGSVRERVGRLHGATRARAGSAVLAKLVRVPV